MPKTAIYPITTRQRQIFQYILMCIRQDMSPPTVREIGNYFKIKSPNGVINHLLSMEKKGMIERGYAKSRKIKPVGYKLFLVTDIVAQSMQFTQSTQTSYSKDVSNVE